MVQVINMEWGNFSSDLLPLFFADIEVDTESLNRGEQVNTTLTYSYVFIKLKVKIK